MKMNYKVASLALVGAILAQTIIPMSVFAEEKVDEVQVAEEQVADDATVSADVEELVNIEVVDDAAGEVIEDTTDDTLEETSEEISEDAEDEAPEVEEPQKSEEELLAELVAELEADETLELEEADENEDFNNDGINDLYTKMLCEGEILTEAGAKVFGDKSYATVQSSDDLDGDGLLNGEEVKIMSKEEGTLYAVLDSDPCKLDSDNDGINDYDDTAKWERGLAGGVLGCVRLIAHHDDNENFIDGHAYIVYTSYVNGLELSIDNLYGYYISNPEKKALLDSVCDAGEDAKVVSWRSTVDELNEANYAAREQAADELYIPQKHDIYAKGTITLNRGDYCSIGNYTMLSQQEIIDTDYVPFIKNDLTKLTLKEKLLIIDFACKVLKQDLDEDYYKDHIDDLLYAIGERAETFVGHALFGHTEGGVWINRELNHQKLGYDQGPNEVVEQDATEEQLNVMLNHFANHSYYNIFTHNCVTATAGAWNEVYGYTEDENGCKVKTGYYVENGTEIKGIAYSPKTRWFKGFDFTISHPGAVKESVKTMKDLPGYIGQMTYVTGKKLVNTLNAFINRFDVTKLFKKKAVADAETKYVEANTEAETTNNKETTDSEKTGSIISAVVNTFANTDDTVTVVEDKPVVVKEVAVEKVTRAEVSSEEVTEEEVPDTFRKVGKKVAKVQESNLAQNENTTSTTNVESKTINAEEVPLAAVATQKKAVYAWLAIVSLVIASGLTSFVVYRRKNR